MAQNDNQQQENRAFKKEDAYENISDFKRISSKDKMCIR